MNFPFGASQLSGKAARVWDLYRACKDTPAFASVAPDVASLYIGLIEARELSQDAVGDENIETDLQLDEVARELDSLDILLGKYGRLGRNANQEPDSSRIATEEIREVQEILLNRIIAVSEANANFRLNSRKPIDRILRTFLEEVRGGFRTSAIEVLLSNGGILSEDAEENFWQLLCTEIQSVGLSEETLARQARFIKGWFRNAIADAQLETLPPSNPFHRDATPRLVLPENSQPTPSANGSTLAISAGLLRGRSLSSPAPIPASSRHSIASIPDPASSHTSLSVDLQSSTSPTSPSLALLPTPTYESIVGDEELPSYSRYDPSPRHSTPQLNAQRPLSTGPTIMVHSTSHRPLSFDGLARDMVENSTVGRRFGIQSERPINYCNNSRDSKGNSKLMLALSQGPEQEHLASSLIPQSLINAKNFNGETPLLVAVKHGISKEVIMQLMSYGADVNCTTIKMSVFSEAVSRNRSDLYDLFIEAGANPNLVHDLRCGTTAMHLAMTKQCGADLLPALLRAGADINIKDKDGNTPLHYAAGGGHVECITALLGRNADLHARNKSGFTALHIAVQGRDASRFTNSKAVFTNMNYNEQTHWIAVIQELISAGLDVNVIDNEGNSPLHWAAVLWKPEFVRVLVNAGASTSLVNRKSKTPLKMASKSARDDNVKEARWARGKKDQTIEAL